MLASLALVASFAAGGLRLYSLRVEAQDQRLTIGVLNPRLSWKLEAVNPAERGLRQAAYQVMVGSSPGASDLWNSGKVASSSTYGVSYRGKKLQAGQTCFWQVRAFDQKGRGSGWTSPQRFAVGLLSPSDWKAQWIGYDAPRAQEQHDDLFDNGGNWIWGEGKHARFVREFDAPSNLKSGKLRITCDDQFALRINGREVAKSSGKVDAWRKPLFLDVTKYLNPGTNTIEVLGENVGDTAGMIAGLRMIDAAGKAIDIKTDAKWRVWSGGGDLTDVKMLGQYGAGPWGKIGSGTSSLPPPRLLRHEFTLKKPVKRAMLYGSALGLAEFHLNGRVVSGDLFTPGWSDYAKRVYAQAYDVTSMLRQGGNAVGVVLGDGWYSGFVGYGGHRDHYGWQTRALVQLNIEYADGTRDVVAGSPGWKASTGPMAFSDFLMGEEYDARKEKTGWDLPGYRGNWAAVSTGSELKPKVEMFPGQAVRPYDVLRAKSITQKTPGAYILDLGQNMAGFARLRVKGKEGQKITLRFAERLNPDGTFYTANLRGARAIDTYTCKGVGVETWSPKFTFHGFQYIEVSGLGHKPGADEVVGIPISSDTPTTGTIETSDKMINQLVSNAWWTQRMNFIDIPTDCPQRDERLGWTGDAQAYCRTATMLTDVHPFFQKWLVALDDSQRADGQFPMVAPLKVAEGDGGPAWADAGVICPWTVYDTYGDKKLLAQHYPQMKKFIEFCVKRSKPDLTPPDRFHCFGDWLNINDSTPNEAIYSAYFAGSTRLVSMAAWDLGKKDESAKYKELYLKLRKVFQDNYVSADGTVKGNSQCAYVLALAFDLLDGDQVGQASRKLVENIQKRGWHLSTGFVGTRDIMNVLSKIGRNDIAFKLLHNTTFPSWGFTIKNGATSIWERWDGWTPAKGFQDPGMNSFAHYAFGAVVGWMFAEPAGITNLDPGFARIRIAPQIDPHLTYLNSSYDSVRGKIISNWKVSKGKLTMHVVIPPNTEALVQVPALRNVRSDTGALKPRKDPQGPIYSLGSGTYNFSGSLK